MEKRKPLSKKKIKLLVAISIALVVIFTVLAAVLIIKGSKKAESPAETSAKATTAKITTAEITEAPVETEPPKDEYPMPEYAHGSAFDFVKKEMGGKPVYIDPLTGKGTEKPLDNMRPVAIMINNIEQAMPQSGISKADVLYECLAEGGITRLLMVTRDYASLDTVGSVRSARDYFIDFAKNHDAIFVHAGGSEEAYSQISSRNIAHLDGVNADPNTGKNVSGTVFYRDPERQKTMAYEHTLVTTGQRIADGIQEMGYNAYIRAGFEEPIKPVDWGWGVSLNGESATHIKVPYQTNRVSEYEYDATTGTYLRYQFNHQPHIDGDNNQQLSFKNIIILELAHRNTGDSYGHLQVTTVGQGRGWYITEGKRIPITWSKNSRDEAMTLCDSDGNPIVVNQGKTMINIVDNSVYSSVTFN